MAASASWLSSAAPHRTRTPVGRLRWRNSADAGLRSAIRGPRSEDEAAAALAPYAAQGVGDVVATPHFAGSATRDRARMEARFAELDAGWARLSRLGAASPVALHRAVELRLDTPEPHLADPRMRLAGTSFVLVEFDRLSVPPRSAEVLGTIGRDGYRPVLAHPERYRGAHRPVELARAWAEAGAALQVNAGSILGAFGPRAPDVALALLGQGLVHYLAGEYHADGSPGFAEVREDLARLGLPQEHIDLLLSVNPRRLLRDEPPRHVPPFRPAGGFGARLRRWLAGR